MSIESFQRLNEYEAFFANPDNCTEENYLRAVKRCGLALKFVKDQTEEICLEAVKQHGFAIEFIKNQTDQMCLIAVRAYGGPLRYVHNQTDEICLESVKHYAYTLQDVINQTPEICLAAVRKDGMCLQHVKNQSVDIIKCALIQNPDAFKHIDPKFITGITLNDIFKLSIKKQKRYFKVTKKDQIICVKTVMEPLAYIESNYSSTLQVIDDMAKMTDLNTIYVIQTDNIYDVYKLDQIDKVVKGWLSNSTEKVNVPTKIGSYELLHFE